MKLALFALAAIHFSGGDHYGLAKAIQEARSGPVVVLVGDESVVPKADFNWTVEHEYYVRMRRATGLEQEKHLEGYAPIAWPEYLMKNHLPPRRNPSDKSLDLAPWKMVPDENGLVSTPGASVVHSLGQISMARLPKPVKVCAFYTDIKLAVVCDKQQPQILMRTIAAASGTKFVEGKTEWRLECDPEVFRSRYIALIDRRIDPLLARNADSFWIQDAKLVRAGILSMTDDEICKAVGQRDSRVTLDVPAQGELSQAVLERIDAWANRKDMKFASTDLATSQIIGMVDFSRPFKIVVDLSSAVVGVRAMVKGTEHDAIQF